MTEIHFSGCLYLKHLLDLSKMHVDVEYQILPFMY